MRKSRVRIAFVDILNHPSVSFFEEYKESTSDLNRHDIEVQFLRLQEVDFRTFDNADYQGFIISGSVTPYCSDEPWIADLAGFVRRLLTRGTTPLLGLCMVHELIASVAGGLVLPGLRKEIGTVTLNVTAAGSVSPLLRGIEFPFELLAAHSRDVVVPPPGAKLLAFNQRSDCQIFSLGPLFGVQSHPEVGPEVMRTWLRTREGCRGLVDQGFIRAEEELESFLEADVRACPLRKLIFNNFADYCAEAALQDEDQWS